MTATLLNFATKEQRECDHPFTKQVTVNEDPAIYGTWIVECLDCGLRFVLADEGESC